MSSAKQQAAFDLNLKLIFERDLRVRINAFNEKMIRVFTKSVARFDDVPNFEQYQDELEQILDVHFHRVGAAFVGRINDMVAEELGEKRLTPVHEEKASKKVPVVISRHYKVRALSQSSKITETTARQASEALAAARVAAADAAAIGVEQVDIASQSGAMFRRKLNGRTTGIVRLNTNEPAEAAKLTQIQVLRGEEPTLAGGSGSTGDKSWANQGDSRVRTTPDSKFNHLNAEQTIKLDKPFNVSGQQLRYPGDTSLGATAGNVMNCRCSVTYNIKDTAKQVKIQRVGDNDTFERAARRAARVARTTVPQKRTGVLSQTDRARRIRTNPQNAFEKQLRIHGNVSDEYLGALEEAWDELPKEVRQAFINDGVPINIGSTPAQTTDLIRSGKLKGTLGFYLPSKHTVHLGEFMNGAGGIILVDAPGRVMIHELGHAMDAIISRVGGGSHTTSWRAAWNSANATVRGSNRQTLNYFLSHGDMNKNLKESFAESFASVYGKKVAPRRIAGQRSTSVGHRSDLFDKRMTATKNAMEEQINHHIIKGKTVAKLPKRPASEFVPKPRPPGPLTPRRPATRRPRAPTSRPPVAKKPPVKPKAGTRRRGPKKIFEERPKFFKEERLQPLAKDGTLGAHRKPDGTWTPRRADLHQEIIEEFERSGATASPGNIKKFIPEYRKGIVQDKGQFNVKNVDRMVKKEVDHLMKEINKANRSIIQEIQASEAPRIRPKKVTAKKKTTKKKVTKKKITKKPVRKIPKASESDFKPKNILKSDEANAKILKKMDTYDETLKKKVPKKSFEKIEDAVDEYVEDSNNLNHLLRTGKIERPKWASDEYIANTKKRLAEMRGLIDEAVKAGEVSEDITVYRGISGRSVKRLNPKIGKSFSDEAFGSWTGDRNMSTAFMSGQTTSEGIIASDSAIIRMKLLKGDTALYVNPYEHEFILKRGMKYKIVEIEKNVLVRKVQGSGEMIRDVITVEPL